MAVFRAILSNTQMSLFKAEMHIAHAYLRLAEDPAGAEVIYKRIAVEYKRTSTQVLNLAGLRGLLEETPDLQHSLARRNAYLDPLNHIQIALLERYRSKAASEQRQECLDPLLRSINAIAAGNAQYWLNAIPYDCGIRQRSARSRTDLPSKVSAQKASAQKASEQTRISPDQPR